MNNYLFDRNSLKYTNTYETPEKCKNTTQKNFRRGFIVISALQRFIIKDYTV